MEKLDNVIELENYKNNHNDNEINDSSFFDMKIPEINQIINFSNDMCDIIVRNQFLENRLKEGIAIQEILAEVYFKNYLELSSDEYSKEDLELAAGFISGIYDFKNIKKIPGHTMYQKNEKERSICLEGYNCIQSLLS